MIGGGFSGRAHLEAIRRTGAAGAVALVARTGDAAAVAARQVHVDWVTDDYSLLLADESIDVIHVCVPNALHAAVSAAALTAGKHVVSEKPLAIALDEADELQRLAEESGLVHAACFNYRFYPLVREARAQIAAGTIGRPILIHGGYLQDWLLRQTDYNWRVDADRGGPSRAVADIGSHWVDLVSFVLGERVLDVRAELGRVYDQRLRPAVEVETFASADAEASLTEVETEDWASLLLRFEGGATAHALVSQVSAGSKNALWFQVDGTEASLRWEQERPEELWIGRRGRPSELLVKDPEMLSPEAAAYAALPGGHPEGWHDALTKLVGAVYRTIRHGDPPDFPTFADGADAVRFADAALASGELDQWQPVAAGPRERKR